MTVQQQTQTIDSIVSKIITNYQPEKIILFGSAARGKMTADSDLDFFIIKRSVPRYGRDRWRELSDQIDYSVACDFVIYTPEEVRTRLSLGDPFVTQILQEGKVLYG